MSIFIVFFLIILTPSAVAEIRNIKITADSRGEILLGHFGFNEHGHVSISIESATLGSDRNLSRLALCILSEDDRRSRCPFERQPPCLSDRDRVRVLFDFTQLIPLQNSFNRSYTITLPDKHYLYFANCLPDSPVTMSLTTEMYNLNRDYLPVGQTQLPLLYLAFALIYHAFLTVWMVISLANKKTPHFRTHLLMGGMILTKALSLTCAAVNQAYVSVTGASHGWDVIFLVLHLLAGILLCGVIVSFNMIFSILPSREDQTNFTTFYTILVLVDVILGVVSRKAWENWLYNEKWESWCTGISMYHFFVCAVTGSFFLIASIDIGVSPESKIAKLNYFKCSITMILYAILQISTTMYYGVQFPEDQWVDNLLKEVATLVMYLLMFYEFRVGVRKGVIFIFSLIADVAEEGRCMANV